MKFSRPTSIPQSLLSPISLHHPSLSCSSYSSGLNRKIHMPMWYPHAVSIMQSSPSNLSSPALKTTHLDRGKGSPRTHTLATQPPYAVAPPEEGLLCGWWRARWSRRHHTQLLPCVPRGKTTAMGTLVAGSTLHITHIRDSRTVSGLGHPKDQWCIPIFALFSSSVNQ
jgi:hypothetical protein